METLVRRRILRRLIWVCTVCQLPFQGFQDYNGLTLITLCAKSLDDKLMMFFLFLPENRLWNFMQSVPLGHEIYGKSVVCLRTIDCVGGLTTRQPLWVILCRLPEKGRKETEEIVREVKQRNMEERGTRMKVKKQKKQKHPPSTFTWRIAGLGPTVSQYQNRNGGTTLERSVGKLLGLKPVLLARNQIYSRETSPLILMKLRITNICSVRIGVLYLIYETSQSNTYNQ